MTTNYKLKDEAKSLGLALNKYRRIKQLTLQQVNSELDIDVGQLSRFERGDFKIISKNLQKYITFLQIDNLGFDHDALIYRFAAALKKSDKHFETAIHMILFLETLNNENKS